jgi:hypothetical protein
MIRREANREGLTNDNALYYVFFLANFPLCGRNACRKEFHRVTESMLAEIYELVTGQKMAVVPKGPRRERSCDQCGSFENFSEERFKACVRCKLAYYCDKHCQLLHWGVHKTVCCVAKVVDAKLEEGSVDGASELDKAMAGIDLGKT